MRTAQQILEEGFAHHVAGNHEEAQRIYDRLLGHTNGNDPNVLYAYGTLLAAHEHYGLSAYLLAQAIKLYPDHVQAWTNLAVSMLRLGRDEGALAAFDEALKLGDDPEIHVNLSGYWVNRGRPEKVVEHAAKALAALPDNPQAHNHMALGLLELGRFDEAWPHYAHRWELPERVKDKRPFTCPKWAGERVGLLAIHGEQGLGDEIMFMGCLEEVERRVDRVVIECAKRLVPIFSTAFGEDCYPDHASMLEGVGREPDAYVAMADLPSIVGMPSGKPYMSRWGVAAPVRNRVGLTWRGGIDRTHKRPRSMPAALLKPLLEVPGVEFVSAQYGEWDHEAEAIGLKTVGLGRDLDKAHALIASCDLVVTVTQTAVHQAGAMGVPCWVMVPTECSWQFSPAFGDRMRWYDSVRLFRQQEGEGWEPVVARVKAALEARYA